MNDSDQGDHMPQNDAIDVERLMKRFGNIAAVDGLDLTVRTGEVHGFLGPNGAGKSTTIRSRWDSTARPPGGSGSLASIRPDTYSKGNWQKVILVAACSVRLLPKADH